MKIDALKLLDGPITVEVDEPAHVLQVEDESEYEFPEGLSGRVVFTRMADNQVLARGTLTSRIRTRCVRCLDPVELTLSAEVMLVYANNPDLLDESKRLDYPDEIVYFDGHEIEPLKDLRELILLELPPYPSCDLVPGKVCQRESLKSGAVSFGPSEATEDHDASTSNGGAKEEPEWKAVLRRASSSRGPRIP